MAVDLLSESDGLITAAEVCRRLGSISRKTLWAWERRADLGFPDPVWVGKRKFFLEPEITAWAAGQAVGKRVVSPLIQTYDGLIDALKQRREDLGMSQFELEHISGLQHGYCSKLEAPASATYARGTGRVSFPLWLGALGLAIVLVEAPDDCRHPRSKEARPKRSRRVA